MYTTAHRVTMEGVELKRESTSKITRILLFRAILSLLARHSVLVSSSTVFRFSIHKVSTGPSKTIHCQSKSGKRNILTQLRLIQSSLITILKTCHFIRKQFPLCVYVCVIHMCAGVYAYLHMHGYPCVRVCMHVCAHVWRGPRLLSDVFLSPLLFMEP